MVKIWWFYVAPFLTDPPMRRTDGRTNRQTDRIAMAKTTTKWTSRVLQIVLVASDHVRWQCWSIRSPPACRDCPDYSTSQWKCRCGSSDAMMTTRRTHSSDLTVCAAAAGRHCTHDTPSVYHRYNISVSLISDNQSIVLLINSERNCIKTASLKTASYSTLSTFTNLASAGKTPSKKWCRWQEMMHILLLRYYCLAKTKYTVFHKKGPPFVFS